LSSISALYIGFFQIFFFIPIILYFILTKRNFHTLIRIGILLIIAASLTAPFYYGLYLANAENVSARIPLEQFNIWSADLTNFVLPTPNHSLTKIIDYPYVTSSGFGEGWTFLGYTAIFLAILALVKTDKKEKTIWIIPGFFLAIISLGPFLKIGGIETGIQLPYYFLYELPTFDIWRSIGRTAIFVTFCVSILAAYGINEIFKINSFSNRKKLSIVAIIGVLVIIESLTIPFPSYSPHESQINYEIASDPRDIVVLQSPLGAGYSPIRNSHLWDSNIFGQTIHEKPVYLGQQSRVPDDTTEKFRTYFLNQFIGDQTSKDIIQQDLKEVGISLFDYFDVGYVIVYTDVSRPFPNWKNPEVKKTWLPQTKSTLMDIFSKSPDFEDNRLYSYKIPEPSSDSSFITLGEGWSRLEKNVRTVGEEAQIKIINPTNEITEVSLQIQFRSLTESELAIKFNGKEISKNSLEKSPYRIIVPLKLNPNENELSLSISPALQLISEKTGAVSSGDIVHTEWIIEVNEISFNNDSKQFLIEKLG